MSTFLVMRKDTCPTCEGHGAVANAPWDQYWEEVSTGLVEDGEDCMRRWFSDRGYAMPPPEELDCSDCEGLGVVISATPLQEALRLLRTVQDSTQSNPGYQCVVCGVSAVSPHEGEDTCPACIAQA